METATIKKEIYRQWEVLELVGFSKSTLQREMKNGNFPRPFKISTHLNGWRATEIQEWMKKLDVSSVDMKKIEENAATVRSEALREAICKMQKENPGMSLDEILGCSKI